MPKLYSVSENLQWSCLKNFHYIAMKYVRLGAHHKPQEIFRLLFIHITIISLLICTRYIMNHLKFQNPENQA